MYDNRYQPEEDNGIGLLGPAAALTAVAAATPMGRRLIKKGVSKTPKSISEPAAKLREAIMNPLGEVASRATGAGSEALASVGKRRKDIRLQNIANNEADGMPVWQRDLYQMGNEIKDTGLNIRDTLGLAPNMARSVLRNNEPLWKSSTKPAAGEMDQAWEIFMGSDLGRSLDKKTMRGAIHLFGSKNAKNYATPQDAVLDYMNRMAKMRTLKKQQKNVPKTPTVDPINAKIVNNESDFNTVRDNALALAKKHGIPVTPERLKKAETMFKNNKSAKTVKHYILYGAGGK